MSNPLSAYDFAYKTMTDEERNDLQKRITNITVASSLVAIETMKKAMENALRDLVIVPFHRSVSENNSEYEWVNAISNALWNKLLASKPTDLEGYQIGQLVDAWRENYPEQMGSRYHITPAGSISGQIPDEYAPKYAGTKPWHELIIERPKK